jgi:hypothetical protein
VREHHREIRVAPKRRLPHEALVEHTAERVDVRSPVDLLTGDLLGRDVVDRAEEVAVAADLGLLRDPPRNAEVGEVDVVGAVGAGARVEEHVGRLHVAMHQAARMGRIEGARHLGEDPDRLVRIEAAPLQSLLQVATFDVAHGDEQEVLSRPGLVDGDDVGMVDRGGELRLAKEAVTERLVLGEAGSEQLERDPPLEPQVLGQIDDAHAAEAEQRLDPVAGELGADPGVVGHVHVRILTSRGTAGTIGRLARMCNAPALQDRFRHTSPPRLNAAPEPHPTRMSKWTRWAISDSFAVETLPQRSTRRSREIDRTISGIA